MPKQGKARSRLTSQGQVSVPARVRETLGLAPGSVLEWATHGETVVVRRAGRTSTDDLRMALFPDPPARKSLSALKKGVKAYVRRKHARD